MAQEKDLNQYKVASNSDGDNQSDKELDKRDKISLIRSIALDIDYRLFVFSSMLFSNSLSVNIASYVNFDNILLYFRQVSEVMNDGYTDHIMYFKSFLDRNPSFFDECNGYLDRLRYYN